MSARFNGFSQDEIHSIHRGIDGRPIKKAKPRAAADAKNAANNNVHQSKTVEKQQATTNELSAMKNGNDDVCDSSNVSNEVISSLQDALYFKPLPSDQRQFDEIDLNGANVPSSTTTADDEMPNSQSSKPHTARSIYQGISLKEFDSHRQMIEESNKEKKEILARALDERFERTTAEAKKIAEVKEELQKLDAELAADVTILRKEIEAAAISYANYKKTYDRIESQFLKAKLELHQSLEKKEMLTEHLCTIISHNEERKAKKLSDLMEKVGISPELPLPSSTTNRCSNGTTTEDNGNQ